MTTHYIDIGVSGDLEFSDHCVLGSLYERLHLALVQHAAGDVGVSFPGYGIRPRTLGSVLRLHGELRGLQALLDVDWLKGVRDHVQLSALMPVPAQAQYRTVQRRQFKTSVERLRRRRMRRKNEGATQAALAIPDSVQSQPELPYVYLRSHSTRQRYCLFIALGPVLSEPTGGKFNSHGLSSVATVPWF